MTKSLLGFFPHTRLMTNLNDEWPSPGDAKKFSSFPCSLASLRPDVRSENPNGLPALSPVVARHELPWVIPQKELSSTPTGLHAVSRAGVQTHFKVDSICIRPPSVA